MYTATRLLARSALAPSLRTRVAGVASPQRLALTQARTFRSSTAHGAVSPVAGKPASEDVKDMAKNALEESQDVAKTVKSAIMGEANDVTSQKAPKKDYGAGDIAEEVNSVRGVFQAIPKPAIQWGAAGLIPYAGTSAAIGYFARQVYLATELGVDNGYDPKAALAVLQHAELLQIQYGAIIISFLGAIHWGFEWAKLGGVQGNKRYIIGVAPVIAGWGSLLITGQLALIAQWAAFFAQWYVDQRATSKGWAPKWYATYRFFLTSVVGTSILFSLAMKSYYQTAADPSQDTSQIRKLKEGQPPANVNPIGTSAEVGDMKVEHAPADSTGYVQFKNVAKEREEAEQKKQEEEKAKKEAAKQDKKKSEVADQVKKAEDN
ncbi:hypothetical protein BMF94_0340 [Rhodotorula taiwanensis]|uniref:Uncharacterized protein n=1 Tax=Rhodotorula taiwanensis TaxID=741276 RepID=A0A2S5BJ14_9BASI|nr:hypothetical protein BMF94_0340 [Rhodotorula taiwanensis]